MDITDAGIKFLKGELRLSSKKKDDLLRKLYNNRITQDIYYRNARLTCGVGEEETGWLLTNQHYIQIGEKVRFQGREYVIVEQICKKYDLNGITIQLEYINSCITQKVVMGDTTSVMKDLVSILQEIRPEYDFKNSEDFFEEGYLDSFDLITLVATLDKEYHIKIKGTDIVPENFCSLQEIRKLMKSYGVEDDI